MGYFSAGWPRTYSHPLVSPNSPEHSPTHLLLPSPNSRYLLSLSATSLNIYSASQHRAHLAHFHLSSSFPTPSNFVYAAWSPLSTHLLLALPNTILLLRLCPIHSRSLVHIHPPSAISSQHHPIRLDVVSQSDFTGSPITVLEPTPAGILVAFSDASLLCVSWSSSLVIQWRLKLPQLLQRDSALAKMGVLADSARSVPIQQLLDHQTNPTDMGGIQCLAYDRSLGYCAIVTGSGIALLLAMGAGGANPPSAIDGRWLRGRDATSVALEPRRMLATVGLQNGDVEQYYVGVPAGEICALMRSLSLTSWYLGAEEVGPVAFVRWTTDGGAFVAGWEKRGMAVWSVAGCRLMWTLPQVGAGGKDVSGESGGGVLMEQGVRSAAWGERGLFLWAAPKEEKGEREKHSCEFVEFEIFKGGGSEGDRMVLVGADRLLMLLQGSEAEDWEDGRRGLFSWQHILIPNDYLSRNWPPKRVAVSADGFCIAVAGTHGIAIYHIKSLKWKVFGDLEHDRRIKCCALAWMGRTIVIGNEAQGGALSSTSTYELLFYPRDQLESSALQAQRKLPSRPLLTDVRADGYLLVICEDAQVLLFRLTEYPSRSRIGLQEVYRLILPTRELTPMYQQDHVSKMNGAKPDDESPPAPGGGISAARIFPPLSHARSKNGTVAPVPRKIMLLRSTGSLILLDTENMVSTALLRYVERFWYTPVDCTPFDMISHRPVWWAYGDDGLHVCFQDDLGKEYGFSALRPADASPLSYSSRRKGMDIEQWFELDPEVYPLSIMSKYGMLLGATQGLETHNLDGGNVSMYRHVIQVKRQPILHTLLRHLLMKPKSDERSALQVALRCVEQPQFADSLEWLLYEAVLEYDEDININGTGKEHANGLHPNQALTRKSSKVLINKSFPESPRRKKAGDELFPRVIRLLKYFGEYEDIVVRCARKLDPKRWPLLFSVAGEPAALLEQCFVSGRLRTAACLLVILQEMWGFISSTPHSLRLVEAALSRGELALAADLANFLRKADRAGMLNSSQLRSSEDVSWIAEAALAPKGSSLSKLPRVTDDRDGPAARIPAVDFAVLNHARSLLNKMDLRGLAALAVRMDFPLTEYLKRELKGKNVSKPFVRDFGSTILSLHRQFQLPEPTTQDVRRAMRQFNHNTDVAKGRLSSIESSKDFTDTANGQDGDDIFDEMMPLVTPRTQANKATVQLVGPGGDTLFGAELPPAPTCYDSETLVEVREKARRLCREELSYMVTVGRLARAPDIVLCCATLLLDTAVLKMVLRGHEELFEPYMAALHEFNVGGYDALVAVLNEIATPR